MLFWGNTQPRRPYTRSTERGRSPLTTPREEYRQKITLCKEEICGVPPRRFAEHIAPDSWCRRIGALKVSTSDSSFEESKKIPVRIRPVCPWDKIKSAVRAVVLISPLVHERSYKWHKEGTSLRPSSHRVSRVIFLSYFVVIKRIAPGEMRFGGDTNRLIATSRQMRKELVRSTRTYGIHGLDSVC